MSDDIGLMFIGRAISEGVKKAMKRGGIKEVDKCLDKITVGGPDEFYESNKYKTSKNIRFDYSTAEALADYKFEKYKKKVNDQNEEDAMNDSSADSYLLSFKKKFTHNKKILKVITKYIQHLVAKSDRCHISRKELTLGFDSIPSERYGYSGPYVFTKTYKLEFYIRIDTPGIITNTIFGDEDQSFSLLFDQSDRHGGNIIFNNTVEALIHLLRSDFKEKVNPWKIIFNFDTVEGLINDFEMWK